MTAVNLAAKLAQFHDAWAPRTIARVNDYDVRLAKARGEFAWHTHPDTDELFLVVHGTLHLLGYDHLQARQAHAMERLEARVLAGLGYPDPYRTQDGTHA